VTYRVNAAVDAVQPAGGGASGNGPPAKVQGGQLPKRDNPVLPGSDLGYNGIDWSI
jgi:hypothetical protein